MTICEEISAIFAMAATKVCDPPSAIALPREVIEFTVSQHLEESGDSSPARTPGTGPFTEADQARSAHGLVRVGWQRAAIKADSGSREHRESAGAASPASSAEPRQSTRSLTPVGKLLAHDPYIDLPRRPRPPGGARATPALPKPQAGAWVLKQLGCARHSGAADTASDPAEARAWAAGAPQRGRRGRVSWTPSGDCRHHLRHGHAHSSMVDLIMSDTYSNKGTHGR